MLICQGAQACGNLTEGTLVMIQGPRHRTDLNGDTGEVISWNRARGRYTMSIGENDSTLNVRSENLRRRAQGMARRMCRRPSGAPSAWRTPRKLCGCLSASLKNDYIQKSHAFVCRTQEISF